MQFVMPPPSEGQDSANAGPEGNHYRQLYGDAKLTKYECPICKERHPADEGIVLFARIFICPDCGTEWRDLWCADCNDHCPRCDAEIEPLEAGGRSMIYEEPFP